MPETIKVEKRKYYSHIYWRVVFPALVVISLIAVLAFVRYYPAAGDAARNAAAAMRPNMVAAKNALTNALLRGR